MAEEGRAAMGGCFWADDPAPFKLRWYFLEFTNENAPWAFKRGGDQLLRFFASLEFMATPFWFDRQSGKRPDHEEVHADKASGAPHPDATC